MYSIGNKGGGVIRVISFKKHWKCFNCGHYHKEQSNEEIIDTQAIRSCPGCGGHMTLRSLEQIKYDNEPIVEDGIYVQECD